MTTKEPVVPFILFPNYLLEEDIETNLSADELYLYAVLFMDKSITNEIKTSVSIISDFSRIKFYSKKEKNLKTISEKLKCLKDKGIIEILNSDGEILESFKSNESIRIIFLEYSYKGYTSIKQETMDRFDNTSELLIFLNVYKWHRKGSFDCSYARWARILDCTPYTAIRRINKTIEKKLIYKNIGNYMDNENDSQKIQQINSYKVVPFNEDEKTLQTKKHEESVANINFRKHIPYDKTFDVKKMYNKKEYNEIIEDAIELFETYVDSEGYNIFPNEDDYSLFIQIKASLEFRKPSKQEEKFMNIAAKRIKQLENNSEFIDLWNIAELRFIEMVNNEEGNELKQEHKEVRITETKKHNEYEDVASMF